MEAYATRRGVDMQLLRFVFDGERVQENDTPKMVCRNNANIMI
jgi:hypothetical protein